MTDQMDKLSREVDAMKAKTAKAVAYSDEVSTELADRCGWTNDHAIFLANVCHKVSGKGGGHLTLEWMIDQYLGLEYHNDIAPQLEALYKMLVDGKHTYANPWSHFKGCAYFVPFKAKDEYSSKRILVMTNENNGDYPDSWSWLVVIDENSISENVYVRKIRKRIRRDCIGTVDQPTLKFWRDREFSFRYSYNNDHAVYGDCRDREHVMTYLSDKDTDWDSDPRVVTRNAGKCDASMTFLGDNLRWFMEVHFLHTEMEESEKNS